MTLKPREGDKSERDKGFVVTTKWAACVGLTQLQDYLARRQQTAPRDAMQVRSGCVCRGVCGGWGGV